MNYLSSSPRGRSGLSPQWRLVIRKGLLGFRLELQGKKKKVEFRVLWGHCSPWKLNLVALQFGASVLLHSQ